MGSQLHGKEVISFNRMYYAVGGHPRSIWDKAQDLERQEVTAIRVKSCLLTWPCALKLGVGSVHLHTATPNFKSNSTVPGNLRLVAWAKDEVPF